MELRNDSEKQENIEELKNWLISDNRRVNMFSLGSYFSNIDNENDCLLLYKSFKIDEVANSLISRDVIPNIVLIVTVRMAVIYTTLFR